MLNPVFSGAHMRNLTPLFYDVADKVKEIASIYACVHLMAPTMQLRTAIESQVKEGPKDLDILAWMGRAALELVGRGGLGYSFDDLVSQSRNEFAQAVKALKFVLPVCSVAARTGRTNPMRRSFQTRDE